MRRRVVVAQMWDRVRVVRRLADDDPDPTPEELEAVARNLHAYHPGRQDGLLPNVRVMEARTTRRSAT